MPLTRANGSACPFGERGAPSFHSRKGALALVRRNGTAERRERPCQLYDASGAKAAHARLVHLPRELPPDDALRHLPRFDQALEVDPGLDAHAVEHVDEVLRRDVARRAGRVRAAAEAPHRRIEVADPHLEPDEDVGERRAARVVHVHRDLLARDLREDELEDSLRLARRPGADRVAERDLVAAHRRGAGARSRARASGRRPPRRRIPTPSRRSRARAGRRRAPEHGLLERAQRLGDGLVHVLPVVRLARADEDGDLLDLRVLARSSPFGLGQSAL